jgi:Ser/Thr protein kinase RdoA (MazF antagonist)
MTSAYDLTTETGLQTYLMGKSGVPKSVRCLEGGTANYVYLVEFEDSSPCVFKHATPYLHSNSAFKFDSARMDFEAAILKAVPSIESSESAAHAIKFLDYDPDYKLLKMEWGGLQNLKLAYENPHIDMREIAYGLAKWLATLHLGSRDLRIEVPSQNVTIGAGGNNGIAVNIYRHSYNNLHAALSAYGYDSQLADHINEEFGSLLATDNECLCHGDFWPGNVLWQPSGQYSPDITGMHKSMHKLTIVDWEMSRRGTSATDVGQFAAEAFLLDRFKGAKDLRMHFLDAYISTRRRTEDGEAIGKQWIRRMAIHWAVHVAFWPTRVPWTDREGTQELVDIGVGVLNLVLSSDWEGLEHSELFKGVSSDWTTAFLLD